MYKHLSKQGFDIFYGLHFHAEDQINWNTLLEYAAGLRPLDPLVENHVEIVRASPAGEYRHKQADCQHCSWFRHWRHQYTSSPVYIAGSHFVQLTIPCGGGRGTPSTFQDKQARALVRCLDKNITDYLFVLRSFQQVTAKQRFENLAHVKDWLESTLKIFLHTALLGTRSTWTP
jgi:hypothetical protein